jgi:hypothetical protein
MPGLDVKNMKLPSTNEIKLAIKSWEKRNWEFKAKESLGDPQIMPHNIVDKQDWEIARDVASFANTEGGDIVVGVEDDRKGRTIQNFSISDKLKSRISSILRQRITPSPHYDIDVVNINGKFVTIIMINEGDGDLCTVNGTVFIRDVNGRTQATGAEITRIVKKRLGKKVLPAPTQKEIVNSPYNLPSLEEKEKLILRDFIYVSSSYGFKGYKEIAKGTIILTYLKIKNRKWFFLVMPYGDNFGAINFRLIRNCCGSPVSNILLKREFKTHNLSVNAEIYPLTLIMGRINSLRSELVGQDYSVVPTRYGGYIGPGSKQPIPPYNGNSKGHIFMLSGITSRDVMNNRVEAFVRWLTDNQQNLCKICKPISARK